MYPEYLNKTVNRAYVNREISPSAWGEVGLQVRGRINEESNVTPFYAAYLVNGLNGENSSIRSARDNFRDTDDGSNENKAVGAALGIDIGNDITISTNYYSGKYTDDNKLNLTIIGASLYLNKEKYHIWGEYHMANQQAYVEVEDANGKKEFDPSLGRNDLKKNGFYIQGGYMITEKFEPIFRFDAIDLGGPATEDGTRLTFGLNYHIAKNAVAKVNYEIRNEDQGSKDDNVFGVQLSVGF